jgi:hypothetical protein
MWLYIPFSPPQKQMPDTLRAPPCGLGQRAGAADHSEKIQRG